MTVHAATELHMSTGRAGPAERGRAEIGLASALSVGAAAIHLATGPAHVESLGDLGLGFYWAALLQGAFAVALLRRSVSHRLAWAGIALNVALIAAWAWSRLVGLPGVLGGPEAVGIADGTTVLLQFGLISLLVARLGGVRRPASFGRPSDRSGPIATAAFAMLIGVVLVSTTFAVADAASGHGHDEAAHDHPSAEQPSGDAGHHGVSSDH